MTYKEAADILDPETRIEALVEIGYYNGFNSDKAQSDAINEACRIAAEVLRTAADINVGDKWVSVKERLPDEDCKCLWYWQSDGNITLNKMWAVRGWIGRNITHWMHLPDSPESEE